MRWLGMVAIAVGCGGSGTLPPDAVQLDVIPPVDAPNGGLMMTPGAGDFGSTGVNTTSAGVTFTVSTTATTGPLVTSVTGSGAADFRIDSDTCNGAPLPAALTCTIVVRFKPLTLGAKSAQLRVSSPGGAVTANVLGSAITNDDFNVVSPTMRDLGAAKINMTTAPGQFTVTNIGGTTHSAISLALGGANQSQFHLATTTDTCTGTSLAPAAACTFEVVFSPLAAGAQVAVVTITTVSSGQISVALLGTGLAASAQITVGPLHDFGSVSTGTRSAPKTFSVTNTGGSSSGVLTTSIAGADSTMFQLEPGSDLCIGTMLAPGDTCTLAVTFAPTTAGGRLALLRVVGSMATPTETQIIGTGVTDQHLNTVSPTTQMFGDIAVGATSMPALFTLSNQGSGTTGPISMNLQGAGSTQFALVTASDTCSGASLTPGSSCTFEVTFTPTTIGATSASIVVVTTVGNPVTVAVDGTGVVNWTTL